MFYVVNVYLNQSRLNIWGLVPGPRHLDMDVKCNWVWPLNLARLEMWTGWIKLHPSPCLDIFVRFVHMLT